MPKVGEKNAITVSLQNLPRGMDPKIAILTQPKRARYDNLDFPGWQIEIRSIGNGELGVLKIEIDGWVRSADREYSMWFKGTLSMAIGATVAKGSITPR